MWQSFTVGAGLADAEGGAVPVAAGEGVPDPELGQGGLHRDLSVRVAGHGPPRPAAGSVLAEQGTDDHRGQPLPLRVGTGVGRALHGLGSVCQRHVLPARHGE